MSDEPSDELLQRHRAIQSGDLDKVDYASAVLHYTEFKRYGDFEALCDRHDLRLTAELPKAHYQWAWAAPDGLELRAAKAPFEGDEGYLSYTYVRGPAAAVERLFTDIAESAHYIKGEFQPLQTDDGETLAELWDIRESDVSEPDWDEDLFSDMGDPFELFPQIGRPEPRWRYVPVQLPGESSATRLSKTEYGSVAELPDGAAYGSGVDT